MKKPLRIAIAIDLDWPVKRHHEKYSGIQDYARENAPNWILVPDLFPAQRIRPKGKLPGYDAVIGRVSESDARAAKRARIPIVNVWQNSPVFGKVPSVGPDHFEAGRMATEHLLSRGLRRLAGIGMYRDVASRNFLKGMESVAKPNGIPMSRHHNYFSYSETEQKWHRYVTALDGWIDQWELPIGVACTYDSNARNLASMCLRAGIAIPEQIAIIGAHDEPMHCEGSEPELSSIDMGQYRAGIVAAELLDRLLKGRKPPSEPIMTPPADLVARNSTDVYSVADRVVGRAMRFIAEHCGEKIRVGDVVAHVDCDRRKLEKQFRKAGRKSINEEIVTLRIELTKRLLISTEDPINDVAAQAGYGTAQHMRHVFRHQLGTTPTAFREEHRK